MSYTPTTWVSGATKLGPTNLNHLETGVQSAAAVADSASVLAAAALPTPAGSNGQFLKRVAGVWVPTTFVASDIPSYPADATKFLRGDGTWAAPPAATTYRKTTAKQVVNTVSETDLLNAEITVAANAIGSTGMLRLTARGDALNNGVDGIVMPRFKLKLGSTTLLDTGATGVGPWRTSTARYGWEVNADIGNLGATNAQWATIDGRFSYHHGGNLLTPQVFTTGEGVVANSSEPAGNVESIMFFTGSNAGTVDTTSAQALVLSVILGTASASTDVTLKHALVEIV